MGKIKAFFWLSLSVMSCGTQAPTAGGDRDLPNAGLGPFRVLRKEESRRVAPFVLDASPPWYAPSALDLDGDPATRPVALYVGGGKRIDRIVLPDSVSAPPERTAALSPDLPWEGASVGDPSALREGPEVWLYYAANGCVGRAVSTDNGVTFLKDGDPVLCGQGGPVWEKGALGAPSVIRGFDGRFHLFYGAAGAIGEAVSVDGQRFSRVGSGPVLEATPASGPVPAVDGGVDEVFDDQAVGDPCALTTTTALGRQVTYLYYTGTSRLSRHGIGAAARLGDEGAFNRNSTPALARYDAQAPSVLRFTDFTLLYASSLSSEAATKVNQVILGAVAPATAVVDPVP
jgi:hypothetical protein